MIKEIDSFAFMKKALEGKDTDEELLETFLRAFDEKVFSSNDHFPEIFMMSYQNDHPFLSQKYLGYKTLDIAMQWMPYNDYRGSKEELDKAIDQENFHCYQLHLYLYYDCKEKEELKMIKEWQRLSSSYQEKEKEEKEAFLEAVHHLLKELHQKGYHFLGYELDFTDAQ